ACPGRAWPARSGRRLLRARPCCSLPCAAPGFPPCRVSHRLRYTSPTLCFGCSEGSSDPQHPGTGEAFPVAERHRQAETGTWIRGPAPYARAGRGEAALPLAGPGPVRARARHRFGPFPPWDAATLLAGVCGEVEVGYQSLVVEVGPHVESGSGEDKTVPVRGGLLLEAAQCGVAGQGAPVVGQGKIGERLLDDSHGPRRLGGGEHEIGMFHEESDAGSSADLTGVEGPASAQGFGGLSEQERDLDRVLRVLR